MRRAHTREILAGLLAFGLVAASCGGDGGGQAAPTTAGATSSTAEASTTSGPATSTTAGPLPSSLEEWEELWAEERAAIVERIEENGWGKSEDGTKLTGPHGWTVDLTQCPADWSDTEGVSDTTIRIGASISLSGTYADYGNLGRAIDFLFEYYNEQGFFEDAANGTTREVEYSMKDDGYDAARAIPNVDELLDSEKVFAIWTLGTPATLKTYGKINQRCVPQPIAMTAHTAWGDPVNHPWTTGATHPTYSTEAVLWGSFIEQRIDEFPSDREIKVASLVQNNDFGKLYDDSFRAFLAESDVLRDRVEYISEKIEASAPTVTDPMTTLAAEEPDVWISMLAGTQCTQIVTEAAQNGMKATAKYLFMPQTCPGGSFIGKDKLGGDGSAGDGWWLLSNGVKDTRDPAFADDAYVQWFKESLREKGLDADSSINFASGANFAFPVIQALAIAGQLDGGVTRTNFNLALRTMDMTPPMLLPGIRLHMDGLADAYIVEHGQFMQWDAEKQTYVLKGDLIDLDGKARLCPWDQATSTCK